METYLVHVFLIVECIRRQALLGSLDEFHGVFISRNVPQIALFMTDAAVALVGGFDLGQLHLVHESCAVAIAAVRAQGVLIGHD